MKRIGILGGTFNPIHCAHLAVAQSALEQLKLDKVIFVPSYLPPHKSSGGVIAAYHRFVMVKLAIKDNPDFEISDFEVQKKEKSYSINTVEHLKAKAPAGSKLFFIIGGDSLQTLHKWKNIKDLLKLVTFAVVDRPGIKSKHPRIKVSHINMPGLDISSSFIREQIEAGRSAKYFLPENVYRYLTKFKLYQS